VLLPELGTVENLRAVPLEEAAAHQGKHRGSRWTQLAELRMNEIMDRLPPELNLGSGDTYTEHDDIEQDVEQAIFATQKVYLGVLHRLISYRIVSQPCASSYHR
jgi:hypothetical protein